MTKKAEETKDGLKIRDTETGKLAGSVSTGGKQAPTTPVSPRGTQEVQTPTDENRVAIDAALERFVVAFEKYKGSEHYRKRVASEDLVTEKVDYGFEEVQVGEKVEKVARMPDYIDRRIDYYYLIFNNCEADGNFDDVKRELGIEYDEDSWSNEDRDELRFSLLMKGFHEDEEKGIHYDFQEEQDWSKTPAYERHALTARFSSDPATHLAMSASDYSFIVNQLAGNANINREVALTLALNPRLSLHESGELATREGFGDEVYGVRKNMLEKKISEHEDRFKRMESLEESKTIDREAILRSVGNYLRYAKENLENFEKRVEWFKKNNSL